MEFIISLLDWKNFYINSVNSFGVSSSCRVKTIIFKPFSVLFQKSKNCWNISSFYVILVSGTEILFPLVTHWLKFILLFIGFKNDSVIVKHFTFLSKIFLDFLLSVEIKLMSFELDYSGGFFLSFLYFDFLCFHCLWLGSFFISFFLFIFFFIFFFLFLSCFWLWNFSFFGPFFNQITVLKCNQSIFCVLDLKADAKIFMLWILGWGFVISNLFSKTIDSWFVLNQDFNWFFSFELNCLTWWDFGTKIINHFRLCFWVLWCIESEVMIFLDKIPVELNAIVDFFVQCVFLDLEQGTFDGSLKGTTSGDWFAGVESSWWLNLEHFLDRVNEKGNSGSTSNHFNAVKLNILGFQFVSNLTQNFLNFVENRLADLFELFSLHGVVNIIFFHQVFDVEIVFQITWENFSLSLNSFHQLNISLFTFHQVKSSWWLFKHSSVEFTEMVIDVSTAQVSCVFLLENVHFCLGETAYKHAQFWMSEINKQHISWLLCVQIALSEKSVIQCYCCWIVDKLNV